jgi:hypothetical protein
MHTLFLLSCRYFRFQPVDDRCTIELDDVDPANWAKLKVG